MLTQNIRWGKTFGENLLLGGWSSEKGGKGVRQGSSKNREATNQTIVWRRGDGHLRKKKMAFALTIGGPGNPSPQTTDEKKGGSRGFLRTEELFR